MPEYLEIPYLVDPHVHLRTPGQEVKEDFYTGTSAAAAGGVLAVMDMPNNLRLVDSGEVMTYKKKLAAEQAVVDYGFHMGTVGWPNQRLSTEEITQSTGLKIYMDETTGHYITRGLPNLMNAFSKWDSYKPILVHAEGPMLAAALGLAQIYGRTLYVCHVSLKEEVELINRAKERGQIVFGEVTPHHLFLDPAGADTNPYKQMKPPLGGSEDRQALWDGLRDGVLDVVGTDHAPHTKEEKESVTPPSGVPGLETTLPLLLDAIRREWISLDRIIEVTHTNPLEIFGLEEQPDSYVEVDTRSDYILSGNNLQTKCKWTPFEGTRLFDRVHKSVLRGQTVYEDGQILVAPGFGRKLSQL